VSINSQAGYLLSNDPALLDVDRVQGWLSTEDAYWAVGRTREQTTAAIAASETAGIYLATEAQSAGSSTASPGRQVAFARVITDGVVFAYLCDVFVDPAHRGAGLGRWLVQTLRDDLAARGLKRFLLATKTAQGVYAPLGFEPVETGRWMLCDLQAGSAELAS
jgi:ribosomal protein S18 acetylase RimI-like enzyme